MTEPNDRERLIEELRNDVEPGLIRISGRSTMRAKVVAALAEIDELREVVEAQHGKNCAQAATIAEQASIINGKTFPACETCAAQAKEIERLKGELRREKEADAETLARLRAYQRRESRST